MKRFKSAYGILVAVFISFALVLTGCPPATDEGSNGEGTVFEGIIFDEAVGPGLGAPKYWNYDTPTGFDSKGDETTEFKNGTTSLKLDWSKATAWTGYAIGVPAGKTIDLSTYNALTFWAKAASAAQIDKIGLASGDDPGGSYEIYLENLDITTSWAQYTLPLPDSSKLTSLSGDKNETVFYAVDGASGGTIYLDDVKFEKLTTVTVKSATYTDTLAVNKDATGQISIDEMVITANSKDITIKGPKLASYLTWASGDETKATVDTAGVVTGVAAGTSTVTGKIGDTTVATVTVTVSTASAFTGVLFDDALQGGFVANKNVGPGGGTESSADIDSMVYAGTSGSSIKFDLTGSTDWGGGYLKNDTGVDASSYTSLSFAINLSQLDASVDYMQLKLEDVGGGDYMTNLYSLTASSTDSDWKTYVIDISGTVTGVDLATFKAIGFWHPKVGGSGGTYTPGTYYVDAIKFGNAGTPPTTYTVTYDGNGNDGGTLSKTSEPVNDGKSVASAPTGITRAGFTLSGWNTATDGTGTAFTFGTTQVTGDITLYAQWTAVVPDTVDSRYYLLGDVAGVGTPEITSSGMTHYGGYEGSITFAEQASGGADGTTTYYSLTGTTAQSWAAGGWGNGPYIDFTGYDTLVFWAKVPSAPTGGNIAATKLEFVWTSKHATADGNVGAPIAKYPTGGDFTTSWTKYEIPLTTFTVDVNFQLNAVNEIKYKLLGNNHELHLDEVYLKASGNAPTFTVSVDDFTKDVDENQVADFIIENLLKRTYVTSQATSLSYAITVQSVPGAMKITGADLQVADVAQFVYATNQQLTATVQITANDGTNDVTDNVEVTINIKQSAAPTDAPTAPTAAEADVINLFSDAYPSTSAATQIAVSNWNPGWSQSTIYSEETIASNTVKKYSEFNYQGIEFNGNHDVSGKTNVHFDLWTADETSFQFFLVSPGPQEFGVTVAAPTLNQWNTYDILLTDFTAGNGSLELDKIFQIKIVGSGNTAGVSKKTVYLDNIYFY